MSDSVRENVKEVKKRSMIDELKALPDRVDRLESIVARLEKAGSRLPSIHDACNRCSTQSSAAHLESVWLCEACLGVTTADKEIISYLRQHIKVLGGQIEAIRAAFEPLLPIANQGKWEYPKVNLFHLRALRDAIEGDEGVGDE